MAETAEDRARAAFGQSYRAEEWAVRYGELAWKARELRLESFRLRENGYSEAATARDEGARDYEARMKSMVATGLSEQIRASDIPGHAENDPRYEITEVHYRTIHGKLLWTSPMQFKRLHSIGEPITHDGVHMTVHRVAVVDRVQHVNVRRG